jgi:hypothetical protein
MLISGIETKEFWYLGNQWHGDAHASVCFRSGRSARERARGEGMSDTSIILFFGIAAIIAIAAILAD